MLNDGIKHIKYISQADNQKYVPFKLEFEVLVDNCSRSNHCTSRQGKNRDMFVVAVGTLMERILSHIPTRTMLRDGRKIQMETTSRQPSPIEFRETTTTSAMGMQWTCAVDTLLEKEW